MKIDTLHRPDHQWAPTTLKDLLPAWIDYSARTAFSNSSCHSRPSPANEQIKELINRAASIARNEGLVICGGFEAELRAPTFPVHYLTAGKRWRSPGVRVSILDAFESGLLPAACYGCGWYCTGSKRKCLRRFTGP